MDSISNNTIDNSSQNSIENSSQTYSIENSLENNTNNSGQQIISRPITTKKQSIKKVIVKFARFQVVLAILQLQSVVAELIFSPGTIILSSITFIILAPVFIISIIIEIIAIIIVSIKTTHKPNNSEMQSSSPANISYNEEINRDTENSNKNRLRKPAGVFVALFSILGVTLLLFIGNLLLPRYFAISNAFSEEEKGLNNSPYDAKITKKDLAGGTMTIQLDDISFDYTCSVAPFGLDSGYGPSCSYHFPDGSNGMGEYIFNKNREDFQEILARHQDTLVVDGPNNILKVINQKKLKLFFLDLMQNTDYNKAFKAFSHPNSRIGLGDIDYIKIRDVVYDGEEYGLVGLFEWASDVGLGNSL